MIRMGSISRAFVFGEVHGDPGTPGFIGQAIENLRDSGTPVTSLALEVPVDARDGFLRAVDDPRKLPGDNYQFSSNGNRLGGLGGFIELARHCRSMGMEVHCVDAPRRPGNQDVAAAAALDRSLASGRMGEAEYVRENQALHQDRNNYMAERISSIGGSVAVVVGMGHTGGPGSLESHLRSRGMDVSSMDVYPPNISNPSVEIFARHEKPSVDVRATSSQDAPTPMQIGAMINGLRGVAVPEERAVASKADEGRLSVGPLRRSVLPSSPTPSGLAAGLAR